MSLNWSLSDCKEFVEGKWTEKDWVVTNQLLWDAMFVGIYNITEKNYKEFYARTHFIEKLNGTFLHEGNKERYITLDEVKRHIGLKTNASALTRSQFNKRYIDRFYRETLGIEEEL